MNKKTDNFPYSHAAVARLACCFVLLAIFTMVTFAAFAGGSIFGGKKNKTYNPGGVYAIGVHFCSTLDCPPIRIVTGDCDGEHMQKRYGVCICDEGYVSQSGACVPCPEGQYSDGINGCTDCAPGTYKKNEGDTSCYLCPADSYCVNGLRIDCPKHAVCTTTGFACLSGYHKTSVGCECSDGYVDESEICQPCSHDTHAKTCSNSKIVECKTGWYPVDEGKKCQSCSAIHAAECDSKTGAVIKCADGYFEQAGKCVECTDGYYCKGGAKIACPAHADCTAKSDFVCIDDHIKNAKDDGCECATNKYEKPEEGYKCVDCPPAPSCVGVECCELVDEPKDVCGRKTTSLNFKGNADAYGNSCYDCANTKNIEGTTEDQCDRCPLREYYKVGTVDTCFAQKCENGFRDKKYGDCYECTYVRGVKAEKTQCDKCTNRVMAGEYCVLKCEDGKILDTSSYTCVPCTTDDDIDALGDDCTKACPGLREVDLAGKCIRSCSGHGHEEKHKCVCDDRWFGEKCDSTCETAWGKDSEGNKHCFLCDVKDKFESTKSECDRCDEREWKSGYCYLKNCVPDTFRGAIDVCYSCDDMDAIRVSDVTQCNRCTSLTLIKREIAERASVTYCEFTSDYCKDKGGFKDVYGNCRKCDKDSPVSAAEEECANCMARLYVSGVCYPGCGDNSFRDTTYECHECSDTTSYETTATECSKCPTNRTMVGTYCIPTTCGEKEIFDLTTHTCVSCLETNVRPISDSECTRVCPGVREFVAGACVLSCSGHGTKAEGATTCTCDNGWYGEKCVTDCNGFRDDSKVCYGCENTSIVNDVKRSECDRCPSRAYNEVTRKCYPPCAGFRSRNLECHACETTENISDTDKTECDKCPDRVYDEVKSICYPPCAGFRDNAGVCHACTDESGYEATSAECGNCADSRTMVSSYCVLKCEGNGHILDLTTHKCVSCLTPEIHPLVESKCTEQCAGVREIVAGSCVLACSGHGTKEAGECHCETGWYGEVCDSNCPGFRDDTTGACHPCADASAWHTADKAECDRCPDRTYNTGDGMCKPPCAGFKDASGNCHDCTDTASPMASATECAKCTDDRQMVNNYCVPKCKAGEIFDVPTLQCVSCLAETVRPIEDSECAGRCPKVREIVDGHCVLTCSAHGTKEAGATKCTCDTGWYGDKCDSNCNGFKDDSGKCHPCDDAEMWTTSDTECARCPTRLYNDVSGKCYAPCEDGFRDNDGICHECTDEKDYQISKKECLRACTKDQREMVSNYCVPKCVAPREIYDLDTRRCVSCYDTNVRAINKEDCEGRCTNDAGMIREYVNGVCQFTCSGHGTRKDGECTCHLGWFGKTCDSDCDGFWDWATPPACHGCRDTGAWTAPESECSRCPNRHYEDMICYPTCGTGNFEDAYGVCRSCTDPLGYASTKKECDSCTGREYSGSTCYKKCATGSEFKDKEGICHACSESSTTSGVPATREECALCSTRTWFNNNCYSSCGSNKFRDAYGYCRECSDTTAYTAYNVECSKCGTTRKYEGSTCSKK